MLASITTRDVYCMISWRRVSRALDVRVLSILEVPGNILKLYYRAIRVAPLLLLYSCWCNVWLSSLNLAFYRWLSRHNCYFCVAVDGQQAVQRTILVPCLVQLLLKRCTATALAAYPPSLVHLGQTSTSRDLESCNAREGVRALIVDVVEIICHAQMGVPRVILWRRPSPQRAACERLGVEFSVFCFARSILRIFYHMMKKKKPIKTLKLAFTLYGVAVWSVLAVS